MILHQTGKTTSRLLGMALYQRFTLLIKKKLVKTCFLILGGGKFSLKSEAIPEKLLFGEGIPALHGVKGGN